MKVMMMVTVFSLFLMSGSLWAESKQIKIKVLLSENVTLSFEKTAIGEDGKYDIFVCGIEAGGGAKESCDPIADPGKFLADLSILCNIEINEDNINKIICTDSGNTINRNSYPVVWREETEDVAAGDWVKVVGNDSYYRIVENSSNFGSTNELIIHVESKDFFTYPGQGLFSAPIEEAESLHALVPLERL